jgi:hypothetical protein
MRDNIVGDRQIFQPDVLLPSQFFASMRKKVPQEPEYRLIVAVLQDAIECFQKHLFARDQKARHLFEDAAEWLASDDREWPYSFISICEVLDLNPAYLRSGLQTWQENQLVGKAHRKMVQLDEPRKDTFESVRQAS